MDTLSRAIPFTREVFFGLFGPYNEAIWPAQAVAYLLCLAALWAAFRPFPGRGRLIAAILAAAWFWTGVAYHMLFFARINFAAGAFGLLFVLQGLLFLLTGAARGRLAFRITSDIGGWAGLAVIAVATVAYPLTGDQEWPRIALVGVAPCPTVLFTFGMLLLAEGRVPWHLLAIPVLWSLVGGSAALALDIPQDIALPAVALLTVAIVIRKNRVSARAA